MVARTKRAHIGAIPSSAFPAGREGSALQPPCARPRHPAEGGRSEKLLVRGWIAAEDVPAPLTSSQTVKRSLRLRAYNKAEPQADQRFRWSARCWWARQGLNL